MTLEASRSRRLIRQEACVNLQSGFLDHPAVGNLPRSCERFSAAADDRTVCRSWMPAAGVGGYQRFRRRCSTYLRCGPTSDQALQAIWVGGLINYTRKGHKHATQGLRCRWVWELRCQGKNTIQLVNTKACRPFAKANSAYAALPFKEFHTNLAVHEIAHENFRAQLKGRVVSLATHEYFAYAI